MMGQLSRELNFPFKRCGKVLVGNTAEDMETLQRTMAQGAANGASNLSIIDRDRLHELVPAVTGRFAMFSADSGILDPFQYTIALAESACLNGTDYFFDHEVTDIARDLEGNYILTASGLKYRCRWVVNCAGLGCGKISDMLGIKDTASSVPREIT